ncbi:MAG: Hydrolase, TatD family [Candidatus Nomurabacteria bacterium GW2011_GWA1_37_20]|uniref:Hydrolase, TatD family n=2 Tax=Parcubacteria group TaxID=1794811 RepID=A0A0G0J8J8_9BACT|nr:MAG: Hydrolase, TatD family [Parcubacteria group bacterium GW2011_GWC1_36_9]KKQ26743.1 MAG: Hydrolase, TatD family [Parcubacteria group bacterium GW2011_GWB1_37_13]KKQ33104.1 MAG: Hydrolase, TatD family [Candidatus Nomurabacteria bacterium GW2011_GWA1_37_20]
MHRGTLCCCFSNMTPKYIDIHSHVNFKAFDEDRDEVIKRTLENDTWMINVGTQADTSRKAVEMANQYKEGVYAIIGLHPIHTGVSYHDEKELGEGGKEFTSRGEIFNKESYRKLLKDKKANEKIVGIGECGLDYYRCTPESIEKQKQAFIKQIELANEFNKPLMLHIRNYPADKSKSAYKDSLEILKKYSKVKGNVHFFAGTVEEAKSFLDFGFTLSFTGVITFTHDYDEIIKNAPLDMIMSETDSPYVAPIPFRGRRNEPSYVKQVVKKIAEIKNLPEEQIAQTLIANAKRVFAI